MTTKKKPHWSHLLVRLGACKLAVRFARRYPSFKAALRTKCMAWCCPDRSKNCQLKSRRDTWLRWLFVVLMSREDYKSDKYILKWARKLNLKYAVDLSGRNCEA